MSKYIVFSDLHLHQFQEFSKPDKEYGNTRLKDQIMALDEILYNAKEIGANVLFLGDFFHQRGMVKTPVLNWGLKTLMKYPDVKILMIEGNHDNVDNSIHSESSLTLLSQLSNVTLIEDYGSVKIDDDTFVGISYGDETTELKDYIKSHKATAMLGHLGVSGSLGAGSSKLDGPFTVKDLCPDNYGLVLLGHYHKRQKLAEKVYYVGDPVAQNFGEANEYKGYSYFETSDGHVVDESYKFCPLEKYPRFLSLSESDVNESTEELAKNNFIRIRVNQDAVERVKELGVEVQNNIRVEADYEPTVNSRIDIEGSSTSLDIVKAWGSKFQPDNIQTLTEQLEKVVGD